MSTLLNLTLLALIRWSRRPGRRWRKVDVVTFERGFLFTRYMPFWQDEWINGSGKHYYRPPWWRPFNVLMHRWCPAPGTREGWHDHPRWSITICLRGKLIEHTPWGDNVLTPGSIVIRSHKYIHAFSVPEGYARKTWTAFIVGRRNHRQNSYVVTPR
jgi:hypothetical protein